MTLRSPASTNWETRRRIVPTTTLLIGPNNRIGRVSSSGGSADTASVFFGIAGDNLGTIRYPSNADPRVKPPLDSRVGTVVVGPSQLAAPELARTSQNARVPFTKLQSVDGFVLVDLDAAERRSGVVRSAKKVLRDSAAALARHLTYAYAVLGVEASGASAAVNAEPDGRDAAMAAFVEEVGAMGIGFDPGKGVTATQLSALDPTDPRDPRSRSFAEDLLAAGFVSALAAATPLAHLTIAAEVGLPPALQQGLSDAGATVRHVDAGRLDEPCDVLIVGSRPGLIDHLNTGSVRARIVAPAAPLAISTRGLAAARRVGITVLADFVTLAGPLAAHWPVGNADADALRTLVEDKVSQASRAALDHPDGPVLGAAELAEAFLSTWRDTLPFGRPI